MKKALALIIAIVMALGCMSFPAFAEETVTLHYYFDPNSVDYFVKQERGYYDNYMMMRDMMPEMFEDYKESHPTWIGADDSFLTDVVKEDLKVYYSTPKSLSDYGDHSVYNFTAAPGKPGWSDVEIPKGLSIGGQENKYDLDFASSSLALWWFGKDIPTPVDAEMWIVFTMVGEEAKCEFTATAPEFWNIAPAGKSGDTTITATVPSKEIEYTMIIPSDTSLTEENYTDVLLGADGKVSVEITANPTDKVNISYTVDLTNGTLTDKDSNTITTTYAYKQGDAQFTALTDTTKVTVYSGKTVTDSFVNVTAKADDWNSAVPGDYTATVVFNFAKEDAPQA